MDESLSDQAQITKYEFPQYPKELPGSFWGLTCFFNPQQYKNKKENYLKFRESNKKQGLNLICVELAFGNNPFELTNDDADILIQIRTTSVLWQKERLLNIALKSLPFDCDKIAWLDCDIIFEDDNWIKLACNSLEKYAVIQLFETAIFLEKDLNKETATRFTSLIKKVEDLGVEQMFAGHSGFAWAARREIFETNGFYDRAILGGSDKIMALSLFSIVSRYQFLLSNQKITNFVEKWTEKICPLVKNSVNYLPLTIIHLYHGEKKNRAYRERDYILSYYKFDPEKDIKLNEHGVWVWNSKKRLLHKAVNDYFISRNEEDSREVERSLLLTFLFFLDLLKRRNIREYISLSYISFLGYIGIKLKKRYPKLYVFLKKHFPDK